MRDEVRVRYQGDGVVEVAGAGVFQHGTEALVPRERAFDLLRSDAWVVVAEGPPAIEVRLRIGQWDGPDRPPEPLRALEPSAPEDFGDLPSDGPPPLPGFEDS